jgi:hypothetical protein
MDRPALGARLAVAERRLSCGIGLLSDDEIDGMRDEFKTDLAPPAARKPPASPRLIHINPS